MKKDCYRMGFHLMPPKGWLNDPNGLCQFGGEYHVFFQYDPDWPRDGQKCWGHYVSADLVNWRFAGTALRPDRDFDRNGAYSGSAVVINKPSAQIPGGQQKLRFYYTGNVKLDGDYDYIDSGREANVVCTESTDGIHFSEKQLLMTNADYPSDYTCHVRDPKVFVEHGMYYMVLGGRKRGTAAEAAVGSQPLTRKDFGAVLLCQSGDGIHWELKRELTTPEPFGYMWECPDLFSIGDLTCLSFCPQGLLAEPYRFQNTDQSGYVWLDGETVDAKDFTEWDMGFEFYAPQTFEDENGRRLLIGWTGLPDTPYDNPTVENDWLHCLTIPRELTVEAGKILQNPASELQVLKEDGQSFSGDAVSVETKDFSFWLQIEQMETERFQISMEDHLFLKYENKVFTWEFPDGKTEAEDWGRGRRVRRMELEKLTDIRVLCDHSVLELFVNGGERVMCGRFYPEVSGESTGGEPEAISSVRIQGCGARAVTHFWHMKAMEVRDDETVIGDWRGTD